jgi:hypothetical protein
MPPKICLLFFLLIPSGVFAQSPSGHFQFSITNLLLWDISGTYHRTGNFSVVTASFDQHANGQITGARSEIYDHGNDHVEGTAAIVGRMTSKPPLVGYIDRWKGTYSGIANGQDYFASASAKATSTINSVAKTIQSNASVKVCPAHGKCATSLDSLEIPLPDGMDGTWSIALDLVSQGNTVSGTASVLLSNDRSLPYSVAGRFSSKTGASTLKLTGSGEALKTRLMVSLQGTNLVSISGVVLGQKLKLP